MVSLGNSANEPTSYPVSIWWVSALEGSLQLFSVLFCRHSYLEDSLNIGPSISFPEAVSNDCRGFHNGDLTFSQDGPTQAIFGKLFYWAVLLWAFFPLLSSADPPFTFWGHPEQNLILTCGSLSHIWKMTLLCSIISAWRGLVIWLSLNVL